MTDIKKPVGYGHDNKGSAVGVLPKGDWSTLMTLSTRSSPSIASWAPGLSCARWRDLAAAFQSGVGSLPLRWPNHCLWAAPPRGGTRNACDCSQNQKLAGC